jgi:hypothetical protein
MEGSVTVRVGCVREHGNGVLGVRMDIMCRKCLYLCSGPSIDDVESEPFTYS